MKILQNVGCLVAGAAVGILALEIWSAPVAQAQTATSTSSWAFSPAYSNGTLSSVWRFNSRTGGLEYCAWNGVSQNVACVRMPAPQ
jgi:hypothetical protein